jgi:hypothetical protein
VRPRCDTKDERQVFPVGQPGNLPPLCNVEGVTGMIVMPITLDLRFWRWQITLKVRRRPQS